MRNIDRKTVRGRHAPQSGRSLVLFQRVIIKTISRMAISERHILVLTRQDFICHAAAADVPPRRGRCATVPWQTIRSGFVMGRYGAKTLSPLAQTEGERGRGARR